MNAKFKIAELEGELSFTPGFLRGRRKSLEAKAARRMWPQGSELGEEGDSNQVFPARAARAASQFTEIGWAPDCGAQRGKTGPAPACRPPAQLSPVRTQGAAPGQLNVYPRGPDSGAPLGRKGGGCLSLGLGSRDCSGDPQTPAPARLPGQTFHLPEGTCLQFSQLTVPFPPRLELGICF